MIRVFPVAAEGAPHFVDDFGASGRAGVHQGVDIFAAEGTPVFAVDEGALRYAEDPRGGHAFYLRTGDGITYYGAHLSAYAGIGPRRAAAGEVIGYVGRTGNAAGTSPHLHFEAHPSSGAAAADPYPALAAVAPPSALSPSVPSRSRPPARAPVASIAAPAPRAGRSAVGLFVVVGAFGLVVATRRRRR